MTRSEKEKGSDALLPEPAMQHIRDLLDAEQRRLDAEQTRVDAVVLDDEGSAPPE